MKLTLCRSCLCLFESDNPSINHIYDLWLYIWLYNYVYMGKTSALDLTRVTPVACHSFFQEVQGDSSTTQQEDPRVDTRGLLKGWLWDCATGSTLGTHGFLEKTGSSTVFKPYLHTLLSTYLCSFLRSCFMHLDASWDPPDVNYIITCAYSSNTWSTLLQSFRNIRIRQRQLSHPSFINILYYIGKRWQRFSNPAIVVCLITFLGAGTPGHSPLASATTKCTSSPIS